MRRTKFNRAQTKLSNDDKLYIKNNNNNNNSKSNNKMVKELIERFEQMPTEKTYTMTAQQDLEILAA